MNCGTGKLHKPVHPAMPLATSPHTMQHKGEQRATQSGHAATDTDACRAPSTRLGGAAHAHAWPSHCAAELLQSASRSPVTVAEQCIQSENVYRRDQGLRRQPSRSPPIRSLLVATGPLRRPHVRCMSGLKLRATPRRNAQIQNYCYSWSPFASCVLDSFLPKPSTVASPPAWLLLQTRHTSCLHPPRTSIGSPTSA